MHAVVMIIGDRGAHASCMNSDYTVLHSVCRYKVRFNSMTLEVFAYEIEPRIKLQAFESFEVRREHSQTPSMIIDGPLPIASIERKLSLCRLR